MRISNATWANIRLLVFDLDGTLADTKTDLAVSVNAVRERLGLGPLPHEMIPSFVGNGVVKLIQRALGDDASETAIQQGVKLFREYYQLHLLDHTVAYPGVPEALQALRNRFLAVLTNKPEGFTRVILEGLKLDRFFAYIYGGDSFEFKKPDPVGLKKLLSDTGASPQQTIMIGDSDTDVQTGRNAGVWTCGVTYGFAPHTLQDCQPDLVVDDLRRLAELLDGVPRV